MKTKITSVKTRNFVQMHVMEFNRATIFVDKKKRCKSGYQKHKTNLSVRDEGKIFLSCR